MCSPMALGIISAATGIAQAGVKFAAGAADYRRNLAAWNQNALNAYESARHDYRQISIRQLQERDAYQQSSRLLAIDTAERQSLARAEAASSGVGGVSVRTTLMNLSRRGLNNQQTARTNWRSTVNQMQVAAEAVPTGVENRVNSFQLGTPPSAASFLVDALGAGISGARYAFT